MSAIASFFLLDRSAIPGLAQAATAKPVTIPAAPHRQPLIEKLGHRLGRRTRTQSIMVSPVHNYLQEHDLGVSGGFYNWSGYALLDVMVLLQNTGNTLGTAEYRTETEIVNAVYSATYLITSADKHHLSALNPERLERAAAGQYFDRDGFEELRQGIDDGLALLHRLITLLRNNEVLVIHIG